VASLLPELPGGESGKVFALKEDLPPGGFLQAQDAASGCCLAAATLTNQPYRFAGVYVKADPVHGMDGMGTFAIVFV
jgi:hypothetical protein